MALKFVQKYADAIECEKNAAHFSGSKAGVRGKFDLVGNYCF